MKTTVIVTAAPGEFRLYTRLDNAAELRRACCTEFVGKRPGSVDRCPWMHSFCLLNDRKQFPTSTAD